MNKAFTLIELIIMIAIIGIIASVVLSVINGNIRPGAPEDENEYMIQTQSGGQ